MFGAPVTAEALSKAAMDTVVATLSMPRVWKMAVRALQERNTEEKARTEAAVVERLRVRSVELLRSQGAHECLVAQLGWKGAGVMKASRLEDERQTHTRSSPP